jgi:hypothetical protein
MDPFWAIVAVPATLLTPAETFVAGRIMVVVARASRAASRQR